MSSMEVQLGDEGKRDPTSSEIQFALVIARMLDTVRDHPEHMRQVVYDLARYKLQEQFTHADVREMNQAKQALEKAISGVEEFTQQQVSLPMPAVPELPAAEPPSAVRPMAVRELPQASTRPRIESERAASAKPRHQLWLMTARMVGLLLCVGLIALAVQHREQLARLARQLSTTEPQIVAAPPVVTAPQPVVPSPAAPAPPQPNPLRPSDYGVYAVIDDKSLAELHLLPGRPPDIRVAVSAAFKVPEQISLPNGHPKFIVFRRDALNNVQERAEVRVVARITREFSAEVSGKKPDSDDAWVIRNFAFPFRISPIPDNPEMYEVHSEDPGLELPPGSYALILKAQAYYFSVDGDVSDPRQCIERIVAQSGTFYTDCKKS